jgi:pimeloyl-ACP methyl ester carboxylesterase
MQATVKWLVVAALSVLPAGAFEDRYFNSNGVRIRYTDQGSGEPVILVHGFAVNQEHEWVETGVLPSLVKNYRVIAMDSRGLGKSEKPHAAEAYGARRSGIPGRASRERQAGQTRRPPDWKRPRLTDSGRTSRLNACGKVAVYV